MQALILLIAVSYVHSSPLVNSVDNTPAAVDSKPDTIDTTEQQLTRITRNNKVEYVYVNADGEIINPKTQNVYPKISKHLI